ncbi:MAG TPA: exopolyphosphatase, partial [Burkholderiaceae bacterium]|nr:exopolyphosphatase [Burkholderiaceae bacterium]
GGRSTELIVGAGNEPQRMESYRVGSIAWSTRYFPGGQFSKRAFQIAEIAAKAVLDEALDAYGPDRWDVAYGSAGTIGAVGDVLVAAGGQAGVLTLDNLDWITGKLLDAQSADRLRLPGLKEDRRSIIAGGISILRAIFDLLRIDKMHTAQGGLRHGLLSDMVGEAGKHFDVRTASVARLMGKFSVDTAHSARVETVATTLFAQLSQQQGGVAGAERDRNTRKLCWAAQLHEIGAHISHSDYHKHGAYILDNADATGFALAELHRLSLLVLGHRGKLRKLEVDFNDVVLVQQLLSLRLAIILCHARRAPDIAGILLAPHPQQLQGFVLSTRAGWADAYPQSAHLLREEVTAWQKMPWSLTLVEP